MNYGHAANGYAQLHAWEGRLKLIDLPEHGVETLLTMKSWLPARPGMKGEANA
jgi:hypothetical protein